MRFAHTRRNTTFSPSSETSLRSAREPSQIRERTFTVRTIKHSFQNAGMWPVSFSAVKKKLAEYGKKKKKDTGLEFLEYGSESESEPEVEGEEGREFESEPEPDADPCLMEEYPLPPIPLNRPSSYDECYSALRSINDKVQEALRSPSRAQYNVITKSTGVFLMRGSLHEMEVAQARAGAIQTHKRKLNARKSLGKGGSILARDALQNIKDKRRQEADDKL